MRPVFRALPAHSTEGVPVPRLHHPPAFDEDHTYWAERSQSRDFRVDAVGVVILRKDSRSRRGSFIGAFKAHIHAAALPVVLGPQLPLAQLQVNSAFVFRFCRGR